MPGFKALSYGLGWQAMLSPRRRPGRWNLNQRPVREIPGKTTPLSAVVVATIYGLSASFWISVRVA